MLPLLWEEDDLRVASLETNAAASPFLRLSPELRNRIYAYTFSGYKFNFGGGGTQHQCRADYIYPTTRQCHRLSLLAACRQIYAEARILPFTLNTFQCLTEPFAKFGLDAMPEQIVSIRHIKTKVYVSRSPSCPTQSLEKQCAFLALFYRLDVVEVDVWHFESDRYIRHVNREREHATLIAVMAGIHPTASVVVHFLRDV